MAWAERADVAYTMVALDFLQPCVISRLCSTLASAAALAITQPLPRAVQPLGAVRAAMRSMMQAQHAGKLVVTTAAPLGVCASTSALVTGGMGTLGGVMAQWLVANTCCYQTLAGRSGHVSSGMLASHSGWSQLVPDPTVDGESNSHPP